MFAYDRLSWAAVNFCEAPYLAAASPNSIDQMAFDRILGFRLASRKPAWLHFI